MSGGATGELCRPSQRRAGKIFMVLHVAMQPVSPAVQAESFPCSCNYGGGGVLNRTASTPTDVLVVNQGLLKLCLQSMLMRKPPWR